MEGLKRTEKMRIAVRILLSKELIGRGIRNGAQNNLAKHFNVTRQRVNQVVREELQRAKGQAV